MIKCTAPCHPCKALLGEAAWYMLWLFQGLDLGGSLHGMGLECGGAATNISSGLDQAKPPTPHPNHAG